MSVCVVHRDGWAASDSRTTIGLRILPMVINKIYLVNGYIIAGVGDASAVQQIAELVATKLEGETLSTIVEFIREKDEPNVEIMVVTRNRELLHVDCGGCMTPIDSAHDFWSIGCADMFVLGYLGRIVNNEQRSVVPDDAVSAIKLAARYDAGIDDRVKVVWLGQ